jgi:hypothetical protein
MPMAEIGLFLGFILGIFCQFATAFLMPGFRQVFVKFSLPFGYGGRPAL